jgi:hypothetical protein
MVFSSQQMVSVVEASRSIHLLQSASHPYVRTGRAKPDKEIQEGWR